MQQSLAALVQLRLRVCWPIKSRPPSPTPLSMQSGTTVALWLCQAHCHGRGTDTLHGVGAFQPGASPHEQCCCQFHFRPRGPTQPVHEHVPRLAAQQWGWRFSAECLGPAGACPTADEIDEPKKSLREIASGTAWHRRRRFSAC